MESPSGQVPKVPRHSLDRRVTGGCTGSGNDAPRARSLRRLLREKGARERASWVSEELLRCRGFTLPRRAVGCAQVESTACIDRSNSLPILSALAYRSGRFRKRGETSCGQSASGTRMVRRWCLRRELGYDNVSRVNVLGIGNSTVRTCLCPSFSPFSELVPRR